MSRCTECSKELNSLDVGIYKKLINRGCREFMCRECLGKRLNLSVDELNKLIERFRKQGCMLFPPQED